MQSKSIYIQVLLLFLLVSCQQKQQGSVVTPWGEITDSVVGGDAFDLDQIMRNGEMIMVTLTGPETYYDYHGKSLGTQYLLCERFAAKIGVGLRVDVCRDTAEMLHRLETGEADVIAYPLPKANPVTAFDSLGWQVDSQKPMLAKEMRAWYTSSLLADVKREEADLLSGKTRIRRRVFAPMLNKAGGVISHYDALFIKYSRQIHWDWRLMAAQCYQESTFDPQARSWAGACGLMQIMPKTAEHLGLPMSQIYDPESNIAAASKYLTELEGHFRDVPDHRERLNFVLGSYNGGFFHIRDAMALVEKYGGNKYRWADVSKYVLLLSQPQYYNDPVVKNGYMRGSETVDYVQKIRQRYQQYGGVNSPLGGSTFGTPQPAKHKKKKYKI